MADFGFAVKKAGVNKNVDACSIQELAASSAFNCFKIAKEGTLTVHFDPSNAPGSIAVLHHGFNFNPLVLAYAEEQTGKYYAITGGFGLSDYQRFIYWNDAIPGDFRINFSCGYVSSWSSKTGLQDYPIKYFLLGDSVKETTTTTLLPSTQDFGIKIMKPGYDAQTDNYIEHINWSSQFPPMKIAKVVTISQTIPAGSNATVSYTHGLGYAPAFMVLSENTAGKFTMMPYLNGTGSLVTPGVDTTSQYAEAYSTTTNVSVYEHNSTGSSITRSYKVVVFAEKASTT